MTVAIPELPDGQAAIIRMHLFEEREMAEVAEQLEIGLSAAWYRFRQGSEAYARLLAKVMGATEGGMP